jgi:hypothetical protein
MAGPAPSAIVNHEIFTALKVGDSVFESAPIKFAFAIKT